MLEEKTKFEQLLETGRYDYELPHRGEITTGILLELEDYGALIDIGVKHDGVVPRDDIARLDDQELSELRLGAEVRAKVVRADDRADNLILSLYQVRAEKDWVKAEELHNADDIRECEVTGYNRGGLLVRFGHLEGFVPGSHLWMQEGLSNSRNQKMRQFSEYVGETIPLKIIEVNRYEQRLVLSERLARQDMREDNLERLLDELSEGDVVKGTVRSICSFGAFVDLGGADGLIHISELAWRRVRDPHEIVEVGQELDVHILGLDHDRQRINLSLKQLNANPWEWVDRVYAAGQLVKGRVTNVVSFGAFVALDIGIEGLLHVSEIASPEPDDPREFVERGQELVLRVLQIDPAQQRISLSLRTVSPEEREAWLLQREAEAEAEANAEGETNEAETNEAESNETEPDETESVEA